MREVSYKHLGVISYAKAWEYQETLLKQTVQQKMDIRNKLRALPPENHVLFCQHPHVYTLGKSGSIENLLLSNEQLKAKGVEFFSINRGGDITYHGPEQLVVYPIFDLEQFFTDMHKYLRYLEEAVIKTLSHFNIKATRYQGYTGVWIDSDNPHKARKICAMGVRCSRWVTMHGLALNVNTDLSYFNHIIPCGITDKKVTSIQQEIGNFTTVSSVEKILLNYLCEIFEFDLV